MPFKWRGWIPSFRKKGEAINRNKAKPALAIRDMDRERRAQEEHALIEKKYKNMATGARQSKGFMEACQHKKVPPETMLRAIEQRLENPQGMYWHRLSSWWQMARIQIYSRELPRDEQRKEETNETRAQKAQVEEVDMQKEGLWIAKAITHYSEKAIGQKLSDAVLKQTSVLQAQQELGMEAAPVFHMILTALNNPNAPGSPKARMEYLKVIDDVWSDPKTTTEEKISAEAEWLASETVKAMRAQAARRQP